MTNLLIPTPTSLPSIALNTYLNLKLGTWEWKSTLIFPIPSVATTAKSLGTIKISTQEREYVKNVEMIVLTIQNPPANNLNVLIPMEITRLILGSVQYGKAKKEILKMKYIQDIHFAEARKIVETPPTSQLGPNQE